MFEGLPPARTRSLERTYGNGELIRSMEALGIAGPFRRVSPWELEDEKGRHLIHAGGYAALPFGEGPPALVQAAVRYLAAPRSPVVRAPGVGLARSVRDEPGRAAGVGRAQPRE
ncbi:MAG: hypothetical protein U5J97_03740 [Trueperaceae bacterium]|nr:hypothetical protein [Trueperaceae bacterium]